MTQACRDGRGSEFSDWLRIKDELDSEQYGYVATDIDFFWRNRRSGKYMLLEEKTHFKEFDRLYQIRAYKILDSHLQKDPRYHGFHVIQFEETTPSNGETRIDGEFVDYQEVIDFLRFDCPKDMYVSYFQKQQCRTMAMV